jgi:type IV secretory pathway VirB3-like protein
MDQTINPVFRALNRPLLVLGVERKLFFFMLTLCFGVFVVANTLLPSLILFLLLWSGGRLATRVDHQFLRIVLNSQRHGVRYDSAKFSPVGKGARHGFSK